ncbi:hypothetical protein CAPTEDRAFT_186154 [Capitella teleta]|uniref:Uncharacterized protein n=1 Tax=Capitella teleta TaxID=283909 RepID=R7UB60_CAPTE|nr:hypothetical protein CAPTEDRAFT_186154 [Capitella teleta]|eukprot:ELU03600.1 hypothetical protein CAPTEDRAFT_186154 [Capitella teleta]
MTSILLVLYEVEARVRLADGQAEEALERALTLPHAEPKLFETIAALAVESPSNNRSLSIRALKVAIKKHMSADCADLEKCSKCFHSLIQLTLNGSSASDAESLEEASVYFIDAINLVEQNVRFGMRKTQFTTVSPQESYPEMQVLWLMTKAWNNGVGLYRYRGYYTSAGGLKEALKWVELAMRFLKHLGPTLRQNYSPKMQQVKEEMLIKMNSQAE